MTPSDAWARLCPLLLPDGMGDSRNIEGTDWKAVVALAECHGLAGLLCHQLRSADVLAHIPDEHAARLRAAHHRAAARHALLAEAARPHVVALADKVGLLAMKGPALGHTVYPAPHLRQSGDIDLLVEAHNSPAAGRVLRSRGFSIVGSDRVEQQWRLECEQQGVSLCIDLHTHVGDPMLYPVPALADVWASASAARVWGVELPVPGVVVSALVVAQQFAKNLFAGVFHLAQAVDLAYILAAPACDRDEIIRLARNSGALGLLGCTSRLAHLPEPFPFPHRGAAWAWRMLERRSDALLTGPVSGMRRRLCGVIGLMAYDRACRACGCLVGRLSGSASSRLRPRGRSSSFGPRGRRRKR